MTTGKVKSIEKSQKSQESSSSSRAFARQSSVVDMSPGGFEATSVPQMAGNQAVQQLFRSGHIQAKLAISQPGDPDEEEADRVADQVMRMAEPAPIGSARSTIQRKCAACEAGGATCPKCEEEQTIHRKENSGQASQANSPEHSQIAALRGGGQPLPPSVRAFFEPRFGRDFSGVRVHSDSAAVESARVIQARAFTTGQDVAFGAGEYAPEKHEGRKLLAHELAHVLQQPKSIDLLEVRRQVDKEGDPPAPLPAGVMTSGGPIKRQPPAAGNETITFESMLLSVDVDFDRWQLEQMIATSGEINVRGYVDRLVKSPNDDEKQLEASKKIEKDTKKYPGDVSGAPLPASTVAETEHRVQNKELTKKVGQTVKTVYEKLTSENREFIERFESTGQGKLRLMLNESKGRVEAEANHYGIAKETLRSTGTTRVTAFPASKTPEDIKRSGGGQQGEEEYARRTEAAAVKPRKMLVEAAKLLQKKRNEVTAIELGRKKPGPYAGYQDHEEAAGDALRLMKAKEEYAALRREKETEFPILATYAQEGGDLNVIIGAGGGSLKKVLADELIEKYNKIIATEGYIDEKKVTMWDVPILVEGTRVHSKVDKDTMRWRVLQDKIHGVEQAKRDAKEIKEVIGGVAMMLGLIAAAPSGGASLALVAGTASTAIGVGMTISGLQEYMIQSAVSGTDFDRARAISQEEPSLFWMAFEIVGAIADVHGAVKAFRSLVGMRRAALIGESEAAKALVAEGNRLGKQLGDRIAAEVAALQKSGKAVKGVPQIIDKEMLQAGKLGEAVVHGLEQHEIIITKSGAFRCSKKCGNIMWLYEDVLQQYPSLKPRLQELIQLGEQGSKPLAAFTQRMDRLREIAVMSEDQLKVALKSNPPGTILGDHLRFEQYRRGGGVTGYEEWFTQSRGPAKGQEVWGQLSEELKLPLEGASAKGLTPAQRQQLLAEARSVDTAESVAGGYRVKFATIHPDFPGGQWQVHHSIPQRFRDTLKKAGINVDSPSFLRGVRTTPGDLSNVHQKITNYWENWRRDFLNSFGREPSAAEIIERAKQADWQFGHLYWEAQKGAGIPVPTKPAGG